MFDRLQEAKAEAEGDDDPERGGFGLRAVDEDDVRSVRALCGYVLKL